MNGHFNNDVQIVLTDVTLEGRLDIPAPTSPVVIFSHGSGSSRHSPRNQLVAQRLQSAGIGTLLFDLLTAQEDERYESRFDIELLSMRLVHVTEWLERFKPAAGRSLGYFGASTGAASALKAAAYLPHIKAVISRGGRPDLAMEVLDKVQAPTLLIVGSLDFTVIGYNQEAYNRLECEKEFKLVEGASHLFEERGAMEKVTDLAVAWFNRYLYDTAVI